MIDPTNRNTALASALAEELARSGVEHAVVSPGSRSSPIALALDRERQLRLEVVLDERAAGFLALGIALASGRPAALCCTSGSAAANLHPAIVEADQAGVPLIVLTSDRPAELRGVGAGQTIDQVKLYGDAVRWFCEVGTHEADDAGLLHYRSTACRACAEATLGRGPVHLNLAWRDPLGPEPRSADLTATDALAVEGRPGSRPLTAAPVGREPGGSLLTEVSELLDGAARPLIVAGRQPDPAIAAAVSALADAARAPLLAEPTSQLRSGRRAGPGLISAYDLILREPPSELEPDLVLRFGDMPTSKPLRRWLGAPGGPTQVVIDPPGRWDEPTRRARALLRSDAAAVATALAGQVRPGEQAWIDRWDRAERLAQAAVDELLERERVLTEPALFRHLPAALHDGDQLLLASSMPVRDAEAFLPPTERSLRVFSNRGANGIDGLVSTAIGLAIGGRSVTWCVIGDLGLAHDVGGLANLAAAPDPLRLLVIDNGGGGIFEFLPQADQVAREPFERLFITPSPLDVRGAATLFGLDYRRVEEPADLEIEADAPSTLLHAETPRTGNVELHRRLAAAVGARLAP
jgi:2-succinyl-5-enolpyruvyl-6-hydroxy-3-cyclohexene-1-carboxylate synthase